MLALPHVHGITCDASERLVAAELGGGGTASYTYDGGGQRIRKRVERSASEVVERVYVGGFERYRRTRAGQIVQASVTKHVAGSIVETWTHRDGRELTEPERVVRYQLSDRVGSSTVETDDAGNMISVEEYFPFGQTAYSAASGVAATSLKRYRFAGKERDEETGLYYVGARYYASWLGRWTAVDPLARGGPRNGYVYAANRPLDVVDPDGRQEHVLDTEEKGELGEACDSAAQCELGSTCSPSTGVCEPLSLIGDPCADNSDCPFGICESGSCVRGEATTALKCE